MESLGSAGSIIALHLLATPCAAQHHWEQLPPLPDPLGVAAPYAGVSGKALLVAGGANFPDMMPWEGGTKVWHDRVWVLESAHSKWRDVGPLPATLAYGISLNVKGALLCIGGSDATKHRAEVFSLRWENGALATDTTLPPLPIPLANAAGAVTADNMVYVACGSIEPGEKNASNRVFIADFNASTISWRELPPLPAEPRLLAAGAAFGNAFYLCGGATVELKDGKPVRRYLKDVWRHTLADGWRRLADLPKPSVAAPTPAPILDGHLLLLAGDDGSRVGFQPVDKHPGFPSSILDYNLATNIWTIAGEVPAPRATVPCVPWNDAFIIPSGEMRPGVRSPEVWKLSSAKSSK